MKIHAMAIACCFAASAAMSADGAATVTGVNPQPKAAGLTATLTAKVAVYTLPAEIKGAATAIKQDLARGMKPACAVPAVNLELTLKNEGDKPVTIPWGGNDGGYTLALQGPGAVSGGWPVAYVFRSGKPLTIAPGAAFVVAIKTLAWGERMDVSDNGCWWTEPGDYTLAATVFFGEVGKDGKHAVTLTAPPVKLTVKDAAPAAAPPVKLTVKDAAPAAAPPVKLTVKDAAPAAAPRDGNRKGETTDQHQK